MVRAEKAKGIISPALAVAFAVAAQDAKQRAFERLPHGAASAVNRALALWLAERMRRYFAKLAESPAWVRVAENRALLDVVLRDWSIALEDALYRVALAAAAWAVGYAAKARQSRLRKKPAKSSAVIAHAVFTNDGDGRPLPYDKPYPRAERKSAPRRSLVGLTPQEAATLPAEILNPRRAIYADLQQVMKIVNDLELPAPLPDSIFDYARKTAARQVTQINAATRGEIANAISSGLAEGKDVFEVARDIREQVKGMSVARSRVVATTETNRVLSRSAHAVASAEGATHKRWIVHPMFEVCGLCEANEARGVVEMDEYYDGVGGELILHPPAHPNCNCAVAYVGGDAEI